jgi:hypothetical protein
VCDGVCVCVLCVCVCVCVCVFVCVCCVVLCDLVVEAYQTQMLMKRMKTNVSGDREVEREGNMHDRVWIE